MTRNTHTFVVLDLSAAAFNEISRKLKDAGYHHAFNESDGRDVIDMQGIAIACEVRRNPASDVEIPTTIAQAVAIFDQYGGVNASVNVRPTCRQLAEAKHMALMAGVDARVVDKAADFIECQKEEA